MQMRALSELFDETTLVVPVSNDANSESKPGEIPLAGHHLRIVPLTDLAGVGLRRKLNVPGWLLGNGWTILRQTLQADAVHVPIPGDVGTIGMMMAYALRKRLFVRYCGNWFVARTLAEKFWHWFMETTAGGKNVMLATGGDVHRPSQRNPAVQWIFSTSLTQQELRAISKTCTPPEPRRERLIIVCRQERGKGTELVIEALAELSNEFPALMLDVVGDGNALASFKQKAAELSINDRIVFHGKVNHERVIRLLQQAGFFCYPTGSEGFPKVVLEALACGLPVITTRVSVLPQLIGNGSGLLLDAVTPDTMADAIRRCLQDEDQYRAMSAQAVRTAQKYSLENWRDTIGQSLRAAWGKQLNQSKADRAPAIEIV